MRPNHPYTITFPIWQCDQWTAFRGRLKLSDKQVIIARWNNTMYLDEELAFFDSQHRIKPQKDIIMLKPQISLLPSILQIVRTNTYTDVLIENVSQWFLTTGNLSKLLLIYFAYDLYTGCSPRDCTLENIIKNDDSIVILDFGLRKRTEKYCVYWNPLILKGKSCRSSYQWSLGIIYLVMTQGTQILNEIQKHITAWLKGGRLNIEFLITNKKQSVQNLISSLLDLENPIPWDQIPNHPAFREDIACQQILKEFQGKSIKTEVKSRSSSRTNSRDENSNQISIMPCPYGLKNPIISDQNIINQSLITKVSNLQKAHQDKVRNALGNIHTSTSQQNSPNKYNNFFNSTKILPKSKTKPQNLGFKTFRNQNQVSTQNVDLDSKRQSSDITIENIVQPTQNQDSFNDNMRLRVSSVKVDTVRQQKPRKGSTHSVLLEEPKQQQKNHQNQVSKNQKEVQQIYQQQEILKVEEEKKIIKHQVLDQQQQHQQLLQIQQSKLQSQQQQQSQPQMLGNYDAENNIQLKKRNNTQFQQKYNRSLEAINVIGQTVAKCLTFFNALQNFWVIPLFLVFKRMLQLRKQIENLLSQKVNSFNINDWEEITSSTEFENYLNKVKQENQLVQSELSILLNSAKAKAEKLDKSRRDKVEWFINDDLNDKIKDVCNTYFHGQIYKNIKDKKGIAKSNIEWLKLQIQAQASIIISELPVLTCDKENFTYEDYLSALELTDEDQIQQYLNKNEHYLEHK
ncbi:unnamed protein product [Paramecium primaurelia]|uniref:Protein kinase domain-containing protein n=1 Tax=Paramecium primaurelia TaxID=5886 RepID=A0A8S1N3A0_PARPR|nr:unnamed protein product [Paramecium primaurelia]